MLSFPRPSPLVPSVPLLRRVRFAGGAAVGMFNCKPFAVLSRPCLRVRGENRKVQVLSSSLASSFGEEVARPDGGPKNNVDDDADDRVPF